MLGNLVQNGDFETGDFSSWQHAPPARYGLDMVRGVFAPLKGSPEGKGIWSAYLEAKDPASLTQIINIPKASCTLTFWLAQPRINAVAPDPSDYFRANLDGTTVLDFKGDWGYQLAQPSQWQPESYAFDGQGQQQILTFSFVNNVDIWWLDDVSIVCLQ